MIEKEELLKQIPEEADLPKRFLFFAILLSFLLNFIIIFLSSLNTRPYRSIIYHAKPTPTVFLDYPIPPRMPTAHQQPSSPLMPAPQQPAKQQEPDRDEKKALDYLVKQLISSGNQNNGQVSLATGPDAEGETAPPPEPADTLPTDIKENEKKQQLSEQVTKSVMTESTAVPEEKSMTKMDTADEPTIRETQRRKLESMVIASPLPEPLTKQNPNKKAEQLKQIKPKTITQELSKQHGTATDTAASKKKNPLTLADITNSFIKQVRNSRSMSYHYEPNKKNGGGAAGVNSPTNATANSKEFALQMYASKVFTLMQQAAHTLTSLIYAQNNFEASTLLEITIDQKGQLLASRLNPSIGEKDIEAAVQTIIQRVGLFPPIPKHFDTDSITLTFPLNIRGSKGFGKYSLSYAFGGQ